MIRNDNSKFLLFIEPNIKENYSKEPINDEWVSLMENALKKAKKGGSNYSNLNAPSTFKEGIAFKGIHICACGETGGNQDYQLENGMITNELAIHYLQHHRNEIPERDWKMLEELKDLYTPKNESTKIITSFNEFLNESKSGKLPSKIEKFLKKFPDNTNSWKEATDEIRDMAKTAKEYYNELVLDVLKEDEKALKALDFKSIKTPSEWNTKGKEFIRNTYNMMNKQAKEEFVEYFDKHFGHIK
jgi:hypothetical protein